MTKGENLMYWEKLEYNIKGFKELKEEFRSEHGFSFDKKVRYFIDENLGSYGVEMLTDWGYNVTGVWQTDLVGKPDENLWRFCQKEKRTILTHDDDFMNHRLFPLKGSYGVVVFPHKDNHDQGMINKVAHLCRFLSTGIGSIYQQKFIIRENGHWEIFFLDETGKVISSLYKFNKHHVFELESDVVPQ